MKFKVLKGLDTALFFTFLPTCLIQVCIWTFFDVKVLQKSEQFDHLEMVGGKASS